MSKGEGKHPEIQHQVEVDASRQVAWNFWSTPENWALDSAVESVRLDGPFQTGTRGRTVLANGELRWQLVNVEEGKSAIIKLEMGHTIALTSWYFSKLDDRHTRISQQVTVTGPDAEEIATVLNTTLPDGMKKLAAAIEREARSLE